MKKLALFADFDKDSSAKPGKNSQKFRQIQKQNTLFPLRPAASHFLFSGHPHKSQNAGFSLFYAGFGTYNYTRKT